MDHAFPELSFDTIIFGSSFMLMPDQVKAIEIAKSTSLSQHRSPIKGWKDLLPPHPIRSEIKLQPVYVKNQAVPQIHLNSWFWEGDLSSRFLKLFRGSWVGGHPEREMFGQFLPQILQILCIWSADESLIVCMWMILSEINKNILKNNYHEFSYHPRCTPGILLRICESFGSVSFAGGWYRSMCVRYLRLWSLGRLGWFMVGLWGGFPRGDIAGIFIIFLFRPVIRLWWGGWLCLVMRGVSFIWCVLLWGQLFYLWWDFDGF